MNVLVELDDYVIDELKSDLIDSVSPITNTALPDFNKLVIYNSNVFDDIDSNFASAYIDGCEVLVNELLELEPHTDIDTVAEVIDDVASISADLRFHISKKIKNPDLIEMLNKGDSLYIKKLDTKHNVVLVSDKP